MLNSAALKSGSGGAGAGKNKFAVSKDNFPVGTDVNEQNQFIGIGGETGTEQPRCYIPAYIASHCGGENDRGVFTDIDSDLRRRINLRHKNRRSIRSKPDILRYNPQQ